MTSKAMQVLEERIEQLEDELEESQGKVHSLENELEGALDGWRRIVELEDDPHLPIPRLELVYEQIRGWRDYRVVYRLVYRHLVDDVLAVPLGLTKIHQGGNEPPDDTPFRDGTHAEHDAAHFGVPAYKIVPGAPPQLIGEGNGYAAGRGLMHRRGAP